jgi:adenylosuccinate lyase
MSDPTSSKPFSLLAELFGDSVMTALFSPEATVQVWLTVDAGIARAQGSHDVIAQEHAEQIAAGGAVANAAELATGLEVRTDRMRRSLDAGQGLVMAAANMMRLAPSVGGERAHDMVYAAAGLARDDGVSLHAALEQQAGAIGGNLPGLTSEQWVGSTNPVCDAALRRWRGTESE